MRRALLSLALVVGLLACGVRSADAAAAFVQHSEAFTAGSSTPTTAFSGNVGAASCVAGYILIFDNTTTVTSVTSDFTGSGTWVLKNASSATPQGTRRTTLYYGYNLGGGAKTITANLSASTSTLVYAHEVSGCSTADPFDGSAVNNQSVPGTGTDALTSGSITTTAAGDYIFGQSFDDFDAQNVTAGTGFTNVVGPGQFANEYLIQSSAGGVAATFTASVGTDTFQTVILALKAAGGGGGGTVPCVIGGGLFGAGCLN